MKLIKTATGKHISIAIAAIYVREAFKKTIQFLPEEVQIGRMIIFNKSLFNPK